MSLAGLLNETLVIYRYTKGATFPYDETGTWGIVATLPCYVSDESLKRVNEDGSLQEARLTRFRIEPYAFQKEDELYYNSLFWERLTYENIDRLGREAVIRCQQKNYSAAEISTRTGI